jgi:RsiW-degrading membrane proteinase PrsW (M82 family)
VALLLAKSLSALLPAVVHLLVMLAMDGYQLVRLRTVLVSLGFGIAAAFCSQVVNDLVLSRTAIQLSFYSPYLAPLVEEAFKAGWLVWLIATRRIGFLVDAAVLGFAVGVGFALTENLVFLTLRPEVGLIVWVIRGFGTAVMHGCTVALLAVLAQAARERHPRVRPWHFLPGYLLAVAVHSVFNQFLVSPALQAAGLLAGLPALMYLVFRLSDRSLQRWLGAGFATDAQLLEAINRGEVSGTPVGEYLLTLRRRFPPEVVADMLCLLKLTVELSLEAKGLLMLRKQGFAMEPSAEVREKLTEVAFLERSIGPTGRLAVGPLLPRGRRDFWQRQLLG